MTHPRGLSPEEAALWERLARTVRPIRTQPTAPPTIKVAGRNAVGAGKAEHLSRPAPAKTRTSAISPPPKAEDFPTKAPHGLDSHWERRLARPSTEPDFALDLHGHTLDQAYDRLNDGLTQAKAMGARLVLVVTGKPRPVDAADRAEKRGAIRAKILDWLAAGQHAADIAAIRKAHRRHGGEGALYIVLKRR
ncbi:Smr/MutS family protein [Erythrobacter sp. EC-HK427]|uniref:Smr/MutS family protein n=1 Tax=Erythrobacter sp. EC-HK427 TaxID=2038396 RepID=UPI00125BD0E7|nr:Smr/MutS family protein [Erythrobacter sp. EC-HK427]VVS99545.1 DNA mismatch repair protein MutS [Erythrobacter sp. EC-HK427]